MTKEPHSGISLILINLKWNSYMWLVAIITENAFPFYNVRWNNPVSLSGSLYNGEMRRVPYFSICKPNEWTEFLPLLDLTTWMFSSQMLAGQCWRPGRDQWATYLLTILQELLKVPVVLQSHQEFTGCLTILPVSVKTTDVIVKKEK